MQTPIDPQVEATDRALHRLIVAAMAVRELSDSGVLFEGYDGAEPQRSNACTALDELGAALDALMDQAMPQAMDFPED